MKIFGIMIVWMLSLGLLGQDFYTNHFQSVLAKNKVRNHELASMKVVIKSKLSVDLTKKEISVHHLDKGIEILFHIKEKRAAYGYSAFQFTTLEGPEIYLDFKAKFFYVIYWDDTEQAKVTMKFEQ